MKLGRAVEISETITGCRSIGSGTWRTPDHIEQVVYK